jgi:hypothetical protein
LADEQLEAAALGRIDGVLAFEAVVEEIQRGGVFAGLVLLRFSQVGFWQNGPTVAGDGLLALADDAAEQIVALLDGIPDESGVAQVAGVECVEVRLFH